MNLYVGVFLNIEEDFLTVHMNLYLFVPGLLIDLFD